MTLSEMPSPSTPHKKDDNQSYSLTKPSGRLTQNFPVFPPTFQINRRQSPLPNLTTPADSERGSPRLPAIAASLTESNSFLSSLAAYERRVLELREELREAEADLSNLKRQWAQGEAGRKKNELRHVERLRSLPITQPPAVDCHHESGAALATAALRASLKNGTDQRVIRRSTRRVFSGSRHTRALSLLSPGAISDQPTQCGAFEEAFSPIVATDDVHSNPPSFPRSSTMSSAGQNMIGFSQRYKELAARRSTPPAAKELLVSSGKKMASDLRDGLFIFFEDIRQATVGDEGINATEKSTDGRGRAPRSGPRSRAESEQNRGRTMVTEQSPRERQKEGRSAGTPTCHPGTKDSFWTEFGLGTPSNKDSYAAKIEQPKTAAETSLVQADDGWDIRNSPIPSQQLPKHGVAANDHPPPSTNELPWPKWTGRAPLKLSERVSDRMKEWESPAITSRTRLVGLTDQAVASPHI